MLILFISSLILAFYMSWNIGANDVANAIGTTVGSRSLSLKRALLLAAICEFCGAVFFGNGVVGTLGKGMFSGEIPQHFELGMLSSLIAVSVWLNLATLGGYPVSTTHAMFGAILGFGIVSGGEVDLFKVWEIVMGFFFSPLLGLLVAYFVFSLLSNLILNKKGSFALSKKYFPIVTIAVVFQCLLLLAGKIPFYSLLWFALVAFTLTYSFSYIFIKFSDAKNLEQVFSYHQICAACVIAFAHGSNDVANSIGPIWGIIGKSHSVPLWLLVFGGIGVVLGIWTHGHRIVGTVGEKIIRITPSSGFAASYSTSIIVLMSSKFGLPISTTHTLIGSIMGITMARGFAGVNKAVVKDILTVWIFTVPISALLSIMFFKSTVFFLSFL